MDAQFLVFAGVVFQQLVDFVDFLDLVELESLGFLRFDQLKEFVSQTATVLDVLENFVFLVQKDDESQKENDVYGNQRQNDLRLGTHVFEENVHCHPQQIQNAQEKAGEGHSGQVNGDVLRREVLEVADGGQEGQRSAAAQNEAAEVDQEHGHVLDSVENEHQPENGEHEAHEEPVEVRILDEELRINQFEDDARGGNQSPVRTYPRQIITTDRELKILSRSSRATMIT